LTVIGNHDYRSNGDKIYKEMFGEPNRSFIYNNQKFILFDDVFWESNKTPDFNWLAYELYTSSTFERVFVFCHIPPYGDEFSSDYENLYKNLMLNYNVDLSIHGHIHRFEYGDYYDDGMIYLAVESIMDKEYGLVNVSDAGITVEYIKY